MTNANRFNEPKWWNESHSSAWDKAKAALRRDWEQTKADLSDGGHELDQDVGDTLKQATGKAPIPPGNRPNPPDFDWNEDLEPAVRYGYGARRQYDGRQWDDQVETDLSRDWQGTGHPSAWERVKSAVRHGWESAKR